MTLRSWRSTWCAWAAVISLLQVVALPLEAGETVCDPDKPTHCSRPLLEGEKAPFEGQLLTPELSIDLGIKADFCTRRLDLELKFQKKLTDLDLDLERRIGEMNRKSWEEQKALLLKRLEEAEGGRWYEHPAFVATLSVLATVLLIWGARETLKAW